MKKNYVLLTIEVPKEVRNAINHWSLSFHESRAELLRRVIMEALESDGFPTKKTELVKLRSDGRQAVRKTE